MYQINEDENIQKRLLTIKQTKQYLNIGINAVYDLCKRPDFPVIKIGNKKFVDWNELDNWIEAQKKAKRDSCPYNGDREMCCETCKEECVQAGIFIVDEDDN